MNRIPPIVYYTVLRILAFAVPFTVLQLIGFHPIFSAFVAALLGFSISLIWLRQPRDAVSADLYNARHGRKRNQVEADDADAEDAAVDARPEPAAATGQSGEPPTQADSPASAPSQERRQRPE